MISAVAELYKLHPQTLRLFERVGLLKPSRSQGNTRLYTDADLERLEVILNLTRELGVNLGSVRGSGEKGRILADDVKAFVKLVMSGGVALAAPAPALPKAHNYDPSAFGVAGSGQAARQILGRHAQRPRDLER